MYVSRCQLYIACHNFCGKRVFYIIVRLGKSPSFFLFLKMVQCRAVRKCPFQVSGCLTSGQLHPSDVTEKPFVSCTFGIYSWAVGREGQPLPSFSRVLGNSSGCGAGSKCCWGDGEEQSWRAVPFPIYLVHGEALLSQGKGSTQGKRGSVPASSPSVWSKSSGEVSLPLHRKAALASCFMLRQCRAEHLSNDCLIKE